MTAAASYFKRVAAERRLKLARRRVVTYIHQDERLGFKSPEQYLQLLAEVEKAEKEFRALGGQP